MPKMDNTQPHSSFEFASYWCIAFEWEVEEMRKYWMTNAVLSWFRITKRALWWASMRFMKRWLDQMTCRQKKTAARLCLLTYNIRIHFTYNATQQVSFSFSLFQNSLPSLSSILPTSALTAACIHYAHRYVSIHSISLALVAQLSCCLVEAPTCRCRAMVPAVAPQFSSSWQPMPVVCTVCYVVLIYQIMEK